LYLFHACQFLLPERTSLITLARCAQNLKFQLKMNISFLRLITIFMLEWEGHDIKIMLEMYRDKLVQNCDRLSAYAEKSERIAEFSYSRTFCFQKLSENIIDVKDRRLSRNDAITRSKRTVIRRIINVLKNEFSCF